MTEARESRRSPSNRVRWAVPAVVAVAVAGAFLAPPLLASADESVLPEVTPGQLVTTVAAAKPSPLSGTVVYTARLGLPEIPVELTGADPIALLGGSSTMRVWTDGTERSRVSLLGAASEYSVVQDGAQAWTYSSSDDAVVHYSLNAADQARFDALAADVRAGTVPEMAGKIAGNLPTPDEAARAALAQVEAFSTVEMGKQTTVAGRDAYQLVVTPKDSSTLIAKVVVAIDAKTSTPLRVQTWSSTDASTPALEIGFTDVAFTTPDPAVLAFSAPAGAAVKDVVVPLPPMSDAPTGAALDGTLPEGLAVSGTGWETVVQASGLDVAALVAGDPKALTSMPGADLTIGSQSAQDLIDEFVPSDSSGAPTIPSLDTSALYDQLTTAVPEGRLLTSSLLSVLVTTDGRVLVGAVPAETLRAMA
ncbi:LolA family protein [Pengzhenrongella phosphoraccumulans]|uniref:LolA family protein n=1 Tax=Pengzhenrongella phosphoraccumulans TaxID=3114394 RepID=UPI00389079A0